MRLSSAEVASSHSRTRGDLRKARASATRCFSPPLRQNVGAVKCKAVQQVSTLQAAATVATLCFSPPLRQQSATAVRQVSGAGQRAGVGEEPWCSHSLLLAAAATEVHQSAKQCNTSGGAISCLAMHSKLKSATPLAPTSLPALLSSKQGAPATRMQPHLSFRPRSPTSVS